MLLFSCTSAGVSLCLTGTGYTAYIGDKEVLLADNIKTIPPDVILFRLTFGQVQGRPGYCIFDL